MVKGGGIVFNEPEEVMDKTSLQKILVKEPTKIQSNAFAPQREVSFFLRLHRHLPDRFCGESPLSKCNYRLDGAPINEMNEYVHELQKDPIFVAKEKEIEKAVAEKWEEMGWVSAHN